MKRFFTLLAVIVPLAASPALRAQDAATEERLNKLNGLVQDLLDAQAKQQKQIVELDARLRAARDEWSKPNASYAGYEDLRKLAEKVQELDKKREADRELILKEIAKLGKTLSSPPSSTKKAANPPPTAATTTNAPANPDLVAEYVIESGDTPSGIALKISRERNVKITADDIQKANPGLNPNNLQIGQKIIIPAPQR